MNKSEEHYKNYPNDKPLTTFEHRLMNKLARLRHKVKVYGINSHITIMLLKSQIKSDTQIKIMFEEMYPKEYNEALTSSILKHGATPKRKVRREEIIISMNLKDRNILRERYDK